MMLPFAGNVANTDSLGSLDISERIECSTLE